uniref:Head-to-tail adaptor n=1 Tax=Micrococcus phage Kurnik TaxID=3092208 RepID=A0AAU6R6I5_9CAUD
MAYTPEQQAQIEALKRMLGGALGSYTDEQLFALISSGSSLTLIASNIWGEYAAETATLVDMSEGNSRRQLGDLYEQGMKMSLYFKGLAESEAPGATTVSTTRKIVRPGRA